MRFEFATAARIIFGAGARDQLAALTRELGQRALVVTSGNRERFAEQHASLQHAGLETTFLSIAHEPSVADALEGVSLARAHNCEVVIAIGGGSVIDTAKAIAGLLTNDGDPLDYLEVVGRGQPLTRAALPWLAVPTTAGTGAEVTRNAVLAVPERRVKVSLRSALLLPRVALVDPELTHDLPPALTAATGLDALTQLIEPYVSPRANPMTDALCADGICRAARSLRRACENGHDAAAREDMALASLYGGIALANAGLGAVHGFAGPIGGMFPAPHGAVCAALLPHVVEANLRALRARAPQSPALARYDEIARLLTGRPQATADDAAPWLRELARALGIAPLRSYGITPSDFGAIAAAAEKASSMKANPLPLTREELVAMLDRAL